jgi:glyoxylase-like metal-dependent hydrolase (beta-lactamase superfamily II)
MRRGLTTSLLILFVVVAVGQWTASTLLAQRPAYPDPASLDPKTAPLEVIPVNGQVSLIAGAGGNITAQVGADGIVLVDSGLEPFSDRILGELRKLSPKPVRAIISTTVEPDHIGGNDRLAKNGTPLYLAMNSGGVTIPGAQLIGHEKGTLHLSAPSEGAPAIPSALWPFDTFFSKLKTIYANGEPVEIHYEPAAHFDGDVIVFFRHSEVISAGDVYDTTRYPRFDKRRGGSLQGVIDGLNHILDIAVPEFNQIGGTRIIPGHGRISNESDVVEYRDAVTIIRDRVRLLAKQGKTLEQVREAGVSKEYDGLYGAVNGPWTTADFLAAVYDEVNSK